MLFRSVSQSRYALSIAHIDYSGVYDSVMNAMDRIKSGQVDYIPSISPDFITYSYYTGG